MRISQLLDKVIFALQNYVVFIILWLKFHTNIGTKENQMSLAKEKFISYLEYLWNKINCLLIDMAHSIHALFSTVECCIFLYISLSTYIYIYMYTHVLICVYTCNLTVVSLSSNKDYRRVQCHIKKKPVGINRIQALPNSHNGDESGVHLFHQCTTRNLSLACPQMIIRLRLANC